MKTHFFKKMSGKEPGTQTAMAYRAAPRSAIQPQTSRQGRQARNISGCRLSRETSEKTPAESIPAVSQRRFRRIAVPAPSSDVCGRLIPKRMAMLFFRQQHRKRFWFPVIVVVKKKAAAPLYGHKNGMEVSGNRQ
jgi:hypothetical protein